MPRVAPAGFTLIETLIASGLLVTVSLGTAQLLSYATAQTSAARDQMLMGVAASAKVDELAAVIAAGAPAPPPEDPLDRDTDGWHDLVVQSGRTYARRWSIAGVPGYGASVSLIVVRVMPAYGGADLTVVTARRHAVP